MTPASPTGPLSAVDRVGDAVVARVAGDIDLQQSIPLQRVLMDVLDTQPARLVIDLSGVPYMDSSGIASLVKLMARARRESVPLKLFGLTDRVRSLFEITRLDNVFAICESEADALV